MGGRKSRPAPPDLTPAYNSALAQNSQLQSRLEDTMRDSSRRVTEAEENVYKRHQEESDEMTRIHDRELHRRIEDRNDERAHQEQLRRDQMRQAQDTEAKHDQEVSRMRVDQQALEQKHETNVRELKEETNKKVDEIKQHVENERSLHYEDNNKLNQQLRNQMTDSHSKEMEMREKYNQDLLYQGDKTLEMTVNYERHIGQMQTQRALANSAYARAMLTQNAMDQLDNAIENAYELGYKLDDVYTNRLHAELVSVVDGKPISAEGVRAMEDMKNAVENFRRAVDQVVMEVRNAKNDDRKDEIEEFKADLVKLRRCLTSFTQKRNEFEVAMNTTVSNFERLHSWITGPKKSLTVERAENLMKVADDLLDVMAEIRPPRKIDVIRGAIQQAEHDMPINSSQAITFSTSPTLPIEHQPMEIVDNAATA